MLNDLLAIERGMAAFGVDFVRRHSDIKDMAKGWAFRVRLAPDGRIVVVEFITEAGRCSLWTLRDGQHNGFPGLKIGQGLLSMDEQAFDAHNKIWESDKSPASRRSELLRLLMSYSVDVGQAMNWPNAGHRKRIGERLKS